MKVLLALVVSFGLGAGAEHYFFHTASGQKQMSEMMNEGKVKADKAVNQASATAHNALITK